MNKHYNSSLFSSFFPRTLIFSSILLVAGLGFFSALLCVGFIGIGCAHSQPWRKAKQPIDRDDLALRLERVAGSVYFATDYNYRKTGAVIFAHPDGIVFLNAGWTRKSAGQLITQSLRYSDGEYLGVVVTSSLLPYAGGLSQFYDLRIPVILGKTVERNLRRTWLASNQRMLESFGSWRAQVLPAADIVFEKSFHFMQGKVVIYQLGVLAVASPAHCIVWFPKEKILYVNDLEETLKRMKIQERAKILARLKKLKFENVLSYRTAKLQEREKFWAQWERSE